jgi:hypothetical protein
MPVKPALLMAGRFGLLVVIPVLSDKTNQLIIVPSSKEALYSGVWKLFHVEQSARIPRVQFSKAICSVTHHQKISGSVRITNTSKEQLKHRPTTISAAEGSGCKLTR